jgi:hypothetical protein
MDKKSIRINFNFNIAKNKNGRNNSHFKTKHYKNKDIDYIEGEIWKPIKDFENVYYVSNKGRIKNIISNKLMSNFIVGDYYKVSIPRYLCKKYCFMYENDFNRTFNE